MLPNKETGLTPKNNKGRDRWPWVVTIRVRVPLAVYLRALRLVAGYTTLEMADVLERWVRDAAHGADRPKSWEYDRATGWLAGHPFPEETRPRTEDLP